MKTCQTNDTFPFVLKSQHIELRVRDLSDTPTCRAPIYPRNRNESRPHIRSAMESFPLSERDISVIKKIKDPEFDPSSAVVIDNTLPNDPHLTNPSTYINVSQQEREIVLGLQEFELRQTNPYLSSDINPVDEYQAALVRLDHLIVQHPNYASARNNRAQILRRLYGDAVLISGSPSPAQALVQSLDDDERQRVAVKLLSDLDTSISLLSPAPGSPISPQAARTLSMAHTQRAAVYLITSKLLASSSLSVDQGRPEAKWSKLDFEKAASRDFAFGGKYGNDIAKGLAVSTNPTAKLCGQIVREALRKEYGSAFVA
ncbi:hypothetical protein VTK73DRAFT_10002 [Phialemonium thermophilum]|uniref:Uncharacterized protein n=1 Tax=Phialemonium thermophilum TaxID=223376 RepID=A0ABR3Y565_9PEZI